jgi:multicomponent Na+:H+ antiporter subunit D
VEDAATKVGGLGWMPAAMMVTSALTAGALLRAGARVFAGMGSPGEPDESSDEAETEAEPETDQSHDRTPILMSGTAVVLLAAGMAWGLVPGLPHAALEAATRFTDTGAYAGAVLRGTTQTAAHVPHESPTGASYLYGVGAVVGAVLVATASALRVGAVDVFRPGFARLRALHSGHVGDYVAWLTTGVAVIGATFALTLR